MAIFSAFLSILAHSVAEKSSSITYRFNSLCDRIVRRQGGVAGAEEEDEEEEEGGEGEESVDAGMASFVSPSKKPVR